MDLSGHNKYKILSSLFRVAKEKELPFVFYRFPKSDNIEAIVGLTPFFNYEIKYNSADSGFIFSPYSNFDNSKSIFIPNSIKYSSKDNQLIAHDDSDDVHQLLSLIENQLNVSSEAINNERTKKGTKRVLQNTPDYVSLVSEGIEEIKRGIFEKVVLASQKQIELAPDFDETNTFLALCDRYLNGFISYVSIPDVGDWLGASPELLVHINHKVMRTVALAGTKTITTENLPDELWTQKEYREQQLVADYVEDALKKSGFENYSTNGPNTVKAGELAHLLTEFETQLFEGEEYKISELLKNMHPTPAICGLPKIPSQEYISNNERFDREFYAGYLGPVNLNDSMDLFVNLRCMQILGSSAMLYAGAGIIANSNPENEYAEIQSKFRTMENVLDTPFENKIVQNL
jgi:isochorismate synthase